VPAVEIRPDDERVAVRAKEAFGRPLARREVAACGACFAGQRRDSAIAKIRIAPIAIVCA
jgi:hypothetical protein